MKAEETLQRMADFCFDAYPTRKHALNQLFCVVGNGFKWKNGELVDEDNSLLRSRYPSMTSVEKAEFRTESHWYRMAETKKQISELTGKKPDPEYTFKWYPLSKKYSYLFDYPKNIKPDWMALIIECKELLIADGIEVEN